MRVLWVTKGLGPGGAERLLCAAARSHSDDVEIDCAYVLPWKDHLAGELEAAGVATHCVSRKRSDLWWPVRLIRLVRAGGFDVVHAHSPLPGSIAGFAARSMRSADRPAIVSTEHNSWGTHRRPTRFLNRATSRWNDVTIAVTEEVRSSISGPAAKQACALRHGIDVVRTRAALADRRAVRAELGLGDDEFVVGTVANFRPQKDYPNLLRAARILADHDLPIRFVAVGQGPHEAEIRELHDQMQLGDRVILTGFRNDAIRVMAACDAFTLASAWEGLPVALMEATALGLPIVATDVGGVSEEFNDDIDALLVPPGNPHALAAALRRVVDDRGLRDRLAAVSLDLSSKFGVDRTTAELEHAYEQVAGVTTEAVGVEPDDSPARPTAPALISTSASIDIREAMPDDRPAILALLQRSLGGDGDPRYPDLFAWKHDFNRFGPSPMWVATERDRIVAFRALMRWEFVRGGRVLRAVRAVDTATDPDYQGQGLFRQLTMHGVEAMRADGIDFVFNTPNEQSRPGYLKMGWREVGRLPAAVRFTGVRGAADAIRSRVPANRWSEDLDVGVAVMDWLDGGGVGERLSKPTDVREIRTNIDDEFLAWRFGAPWLGYRVLDDGDSAVIVRARMRGASKELAVVAEFGAAVATQRLAARAAKEARCSYAIRIGAPNARAGYVPLPGGGPILTWRAANDARFPPLPNWALTLGDVELF